MQKIYTRITWDISGEEIVLDSADYFWYDGNIEHLCGASAAQNAAQAAQATAYTQMTQQASQVFGASSSVFQNLQATFQPTIAAGPDQQGFSAAQLANLNSQAITEGGVAARNASQAVGENIAAEGGGNNPALQSGVNTGVQLSTENAAAANTANQLNTITQANYAQGNANYNAATAGLAGSVNAFNPASTAGSVATGAGVASANTANQIASQNNSWMQAVSGAVGAVGGAFASGGLSLLAGNGSGSGGLTGGTGLNTLENEAAGAGPVATQSADTSGIYVGAT